MARRLSINLPVFSLSPDNEIATGQYIRLRQCIRDAFESFLRNLNLKSLSALEHAFQKHGGEMNSSKFLKVVTEVFPAPETPHRTTIMEKKFIQQMACLMLFESVDVDCSGEASWMEFVEFVCAIAEELRLQAAEESGQTFEFFEAEQVALPFRPQITKCHFDRVFFWPQHPIDSAVIFEEGQPACHLHFPRTMVRRRRVEGGHRQELLSASFMPAPFQWVVTSGNDNLVCFWDENFNLVKRWSVDHVWTGEKGKVTSIGALCWCPEIKALYAADHFSQMVRAWRIDSPLDVRASNSAFEPDKRLELKKQMTHTKSVQAICWMSALKCLATASLDTTVQIFDLVEMKRTYTLSGHKRGLTCLQYCEKNHMLMSCGFDNYICIWDPGAGTLSFTLTGHECSIAGLCSIPGTDYEFMSVDFEGQVRLWDVRRVVCLQNFCATDKQAEKNGELEPLEPRAICALGTNRVLISGRRMVVFDREAPNPHLTADWQIHAVAFNERRIEIVTPIKNDLYVWCALTGMLRTVHDNVIEGTITAMTLDLSERRIFVGADDGEIHVVNYGCGALLKKLTPHQYEVTQITCIPEKVLTLSAPEKMLVIHDDNESDRSFVLKRIDLSGAGAITQFAYDGGSVIACTSQDWKVVWYHMDFAKEVSRSDGGEEKKRATSAVGSLRDAGDEEFFNVDFPDSMSSSDGCEVKHASAVTCGVYLTDAPLLATADADGAVIFWSMPPLRTYSFFSKVSLDIPGAVGPFIVSSIALSHPDEERLYIGLERGMLVCIDISYIVQSAKSLRQEILRRKEAGEAAAVISGRIFEEMPKPCNKPEYVFKLTTTWASSAHRGSIDKIVVCPRDPAVLLTLGSDQRVCMWSHDSGEALGTLEQGLPEGLHHKPLTEWKFPIRAAEELERDKSFIEDAAEEASDDSDSDDSSSLKTGSSSPAQPLQRSPRRRLQNSQASIPSITGASAAASSAAVSPKRSPQEPPPPQAEKRLAAARSAPDLRPGSKSQRPTSSSGNAAGNAAGSAAGSAHRLGRRKGSAAGEAWLLGSGGGAGSPKAGGNSPTKGSRLQALTQHKGSGQRGVEWYAGPFAAGHFASPSLYGPPMALPKLPSGRERPKFSKSKDLVAAARRLSSALGDLDGRNSKDIF
mmetsp:Transcript_14193/g.40804  ORF Transcript_14193/g.40804 Transcript_14193/m.40804 type:complete len:1142 (-) Transcript_14193:83-3508(-)